MSTASSACQEVDKADLLASLLRSGRLNSRSSWSLELRVLVELVAFLMVGELQLRTELRVVAG